MADEGTSGSEPQPQRRAPRSSSPAKRLHSDMADDSMDLDSQASTTRRNSGQSSPRNTKPIAAGASQRSARATSVDMADAPNNSGSDNADSSATSIDATQQADLPSLDEQVTKVMTMMQKPLEERQEGYVISEKWLERVWARTSENVGRPQDFSKEATQGPIGPVDNTCLVDTDAMQDDLMDQRGEDFVPLKEGASMGQDFEILPLKAWELVVGWYGVKTGSPTIRRYAYNTVPDKSTENLEYELRPPILTIRKVRQAPTTAADTSRVAGKIVASKYESYLTFLEAAKKSAGIDIRNKVRVWRILNIAGSDIPKDAQPSGMLTPDASPRDGSPVVPAPNQSPALIMDATSFNNLAYGTERELVTGKDEQANEDFNESLTLAGAGLSQDQVIVLEEHNEKGEYISDAAKVAAKNKTGSQANKGIQSTTNSGTSTPTGGPLTRSKRRDGRVRGHVGLTNLGNTCYMNSALQCLRSVEELSMYFLSGKWKGHINANNPIGHKGAIARNYAAVLSGIYDINASSSFSPKAFKNALGKANSLFSGYGQQDSQEFVSWLVDALHEDLNRIQKKPYTENPDSDDNTFRDPEAIRELGEIYRNNHKARNDSVSMDLFSGFYKNTMVCPDCEKVSITFDPYSQLTLQLPIEQTWNHTITYIPLYGKPYQVEVDMDKNATIRSLKEYVGKRGGGVPASRLMASEVYSHKFYRHLDDKNTIAESNIGVRDDIYIYELDIAPSNWPAPKKKGSGFKLLLSHGSSDEDVPDSASPLHDRVIIPVFHRGPNSSSYKSNNFSMALSPFFIVLTRKEAKDPDAILRKLLAKVAQMTTRDILNELGDSPLTQSRSGSDVVLTTEEDASPNGDPRVQDGSIEGEDLVEVTMTDSVDTALDQTTDKEKIPSVLKPGSFIHPEFRTLFEIKHTKKTNEIVTTGWSSVDPSKALEPISKRIRLPPSREESVQSSPDGSEGSSSDEDADTPQSIDVDAAIDAANVSSDEEMQSIEPGGHVASRGGRQNKKKSKKQRKQERKQERKHKNNKNFKSKKNRVPDQPEYPDDPEDESEDRLVRMGEGLVLDWDPNSFEALFGGTTADDARGMDAMKWLETREDPEIQAKKERRAARRKHGITLDECFTETSKSEILSEDNAWYCSRCKELRRAKKTLEIWTVPDILIIHLKRFSGHRTFRDKIEELIDFPVEGLDLSGKVGFPEGKDLTYDLFAVDNHFGGLGGGHYTATAQNFYDKQWYDYNDSVVSKCTSGQKAVTRSAYLLFYRRRSPVPLGPDHLREIVQAAETDATADSDAEDDDSNNRSRPRDANKSDSGNGQRLDGSSRNGSSSAGIGAAAGALAQRGHGFSDRGSLLKSGAGVVNLSDDEDMPPMVDGSADEGFVDAEDGNDYTTFGGFQGSNDPMWSFEALGASSNRLHGSSDVASDAPNLGSEGPDDLSSRMLEDFGDDMHDGEDAPVDDVDDVHEIRVPSE
ncbi:ubiquitinyl hydrolase 1 [Parastagonospora nodorum]|uniref:ubiquitinyl hydrolase 1 n=1 Tax=Phaeosphaeria nodorum (strain SN15 / ATCC MYA-4574 / FGSC 10173) TaxID=321614 RepID=A0A7U2I5G5_PHANO|nr:ubiquitinyl hydrolase 1 [Parastagonospora nodorum]QRD04116.1 ubiquitinyl hydrolase 1 [Parastagonospora nodorum SN15]KAH3925977.1 ubiquitinyl hydrolase 1 [Parastagonospora nodorum]KAH3962525.1 ubiquitinyl hydrolase 1 [Parastagonospora nodorum]KAH4017362.1 ubiquitinyl hydrolase 1 [Parastagonospora nodorum]